MIKYIAIGILAYMFYAGGLVRFSEDEVGIGFVPNKVVSKIVLDFETLIENVEKEILWKN